MLVRNLTLSLLAASALSACTLAPRTERPALPVANAWPVATADAGQAASAADLAWRDVFIDPRLQGVIDLALSNNRDLRVAVLNIEKARAQYRVQRAALLPGVAATATGTRSQTTEAQSALQGGDRTTTAYTAGVGVTAWELDLFGRVRSLKDAALQSYLATRETSRSVQISLIAQTANSWLALAADQDLLALAQDTLRTREESLKLIRSRFDAGAANQLDLRQAETLAETARSDVATYVAQVEQDKNALRLVAGADVPADLLPAGGLVTAQILPDLPPGIPSDVLTRRPDVLAAEHALAGANANIGAARAAFFPSISLTAQAGVASGSLSSLFDGGNGTWSFAPRVSLPIFAGGANVANLDSAKASRDIAVANYEKAVQTAFREVSDGLAVQSTIQDRVGSQERLVAAANDSVRLSRARYGAGIDSSLTLLDAQRTLYTAQQGLIGARLARAANLATLYKALGGGAPAGR
ncbi:efflux transporter outer membrane subunit [Caulobacter sp. UNC279MFTsu5.1]|uniref:efflux transporter outer membrane subunit n=1 Tax=Caulobacter sp. UNC279MFTsu5.1 TaxID=1502775 RepID=UPI000376BCEE|nr:efflux transporter outer membrane subunit [Caulobacter sp. UNC279MFTsu5.1]SFI80708.1 outer membrane protein, multidrug efflux system [Caulobacter sp. UNC279MFTsu5.1]